MLHPYPVVESARVERFAVRDEEDLRELPADEALSQKVHERESARSIEAAEWLVEKEPGRSYIILARQCRQRKSQAQGKRDLIARAAGEDAFALELAGAAVVDRESVVLAIPLYVVVAPFRQEGQKLTHILLRERHDPIDNRLARFRDDLACAPFHVQPLARFFPGPRLRFHV